MRGATLYLRAKLDWSASMLSSQLPRTRSEADALEEAGKAYLSCYLQLNLLSMRLGSYS